jgi:adenine-specific DNA-methyltransferase
MGDLVAARRLGVYYTPDDIALGLTRWALAGGATRVLDPSCGDGRFIRAAATLLADAAGPDVVGIDVDEAAVRALRAQYVRGVRLDARSFFDLPPVACQGAPFGAVVGNPPYVRHHWQDSAVLESARNRAAEAGVTLSGLADLWAYFVIHATQHVALDGRLSLVLPVAATQAEYAQDVWNFVQHNFSHVELLVLQDRAFEHAREQPVVLLASGRGGSTTAIQTAVVRTVADLLGRLDVPVVGDAEPAVPEGIVKWKWNMLPVGTRRLWSELHAAPEVRSLGRCAVVRIGTVTGANALFIRRAGDPLLDEPGVAPRPVVTSSRVLKTAVWRTVDDRATGERRGGGRLLVIDPASKPSGRLRATLDAAETEDVHERHHCGGRDPWWGLRDLDAPDAFLGYMGTNPHSLVRNASGALCTNAIHRITWKRRGSLRGAVVASWSSLFRLSAELYGRHYGGGVLKIEPSAAKRLPIVPSGTLANALAEIDASLRMEQRRTALRLADKRVAAVLGATPSDLRRLGEAAEALAAVRRIPR